MVFRQLPPPSYLQEYVRYFWTLSSGGQHLPALALGPLADGCPGLIFHHTEDGRFCDEFGKELPVVFLYGQTVSRTALYISGRFRLTGACLYPHALKPLTRCDAVELTDVCIEPNQLGNLQQLKLGEQLLHTSCPAEQVGILSRALYALLSNTTALPDPMILQALQLIRDTNGQIALPYLRERLGLSERHLERLFNRQVGLSPKMYARICQFQASLQQLKASRFVKLSDIAYENGYADQAHFIRSFKTFTGHAPQAFRKQAEQSSGVILP